MKPDSSSSASPAPGDERSAQRRIMALLDPITSIAVIAVCIVALWPHVPAGRGLVPSKPETIVNRPSAALAIPADPIVPGDVAWLGDAHSPIVMIIYSDFQCPFCRRFALDTLPEIIREYVVGGRVRLAYKNLPLVIHKDAFRAAEAGECARRQGKFWEMHDRLFKGATELDEASLLRDARELGLNGPQFGACLSGQAKAKVEADAADAKKLAVKGTPAFFVGTVLADGSVRVVRGLRGAQSAEQFRQTLDDVIATVTQHKKAI